jgi:predicted enzyme related to lactoylglutathione lyase
VNRVRIEGVTTQGARMIRKIKFISIPVRDQDRALDFYINRLGFILVTDQTMGPGQRWIEIKPPKGETGLALFTPPGQEDRIGSFAGASFDCDDVEKTYAELTAKGVEFVKPPQKQPWGTMAIMKDSEGNQIVLGS